MDVTSNKSQQGTEGKDELADADEPEPDSIKYHHLENRKGRFIIEDLEEAALDDAYDDAGINFQMSFRKKKFDFFHREVLEEEVAGMDYGASYIYDNNRGSFLQVEEIGQYFKFDFRFLIKFTDAYNYKDQNFGSNYNITGGENIGNGLNSEEEELLENEYALIIHEETNDHENVTECVGKLESQNKISESQNKIIMPEILLTNNFDLNLSQKIKSPLCSPICSPRSRYLRPGNSHYKSLQSSSKHQRVKALKHFIKSIDDSFQLNNDNNLYQTSTGTFFRNKRLYSDDKVPIGVRNDSIRKFAIFRSGSEDHDTRKRCHSPLNKKVGHIRENNFQLIQEAQEKFIPDPLDTRDTRDAPDIPDAAEIDIDSPSICNLIKREFSIEHTNSLTLSSIDNLIESKSTLSNTYDTMDSKLCSNCMSIGIIVKSEKYSK
jgi:hypothetical protein